jgi:hypothetical protein
MPNDLLRLKVQRKNGCERFGQDGADAGFDLLSFWQWSVSDLVSNATRGVLAEYIVAQALGVATETRNEWDAFDLRATPTLKVEVKSSSYIQSWFQKDLSSIVFVVGPRRQWDADTNVQNKQSEWQADVYVFALLKHQDKKTVDPMNLDQWDFYVVGVSTLKNRTTSQKSITLKSLRTFCPVPVKFGELRAAVLKFSE